MIRPAQADDAAEIAEIYNHYVLNSTITFEETAVSASEMQSRIKTIQDQGLCWYVCELSWKVKGYAYVSPWKLRNAYRYSVESAIYVVAGETGAGIGSELYSELIAKLTEEGYHRIFAGLLLPNEPSTRLHEKFGFEKVAHFSESGYKFDKWIDVGYWQLLI